MASSNIGHAVANSIVIVANLLSHQTIKVTRLSVPELVQVNTSTLTLDCEYLVHDDKFIVQWLFNKHKTPIYEWRPRTEPVVRDLFNGRLDLKYKVSNVPIYEHRALRVTDPVPELSGEYTCIIKTDSGLQDQNTKTMVIFSPEHEFVLTIKYEETIEIDCIARGLYPQPTMVLERNNALLPTQAQRVWRNGSLYDASCSAHVTPNHVRSEDRITCRLLLPQAGYSAIRGETLHLKNYLHQKKCRSKNINLIMESAKKPCNSALKSIDQIQVCFNIILTNLIILYST